MHAQSLEQMEKGELLQLVRRHHFMMTDLALYLDTHPTDRAALQRFTESRELFRQHADAYAARFGALTKEQVCDAQGWGMWSNTPWPWEREAN